MATKSCAFDVVLDKQLRQLQAVLVPKIQRVIDETTKDRLKIVLEQNDGLQNQVSALRGKITKTIQDLNAVSKLDASAIQHTLSSLNEAFDQNVKMDYDSIETFDCGQMQIEVPGVITDCPQEVQPVWACEATDGAPRENAERYMLPVLCSTSPDERTLELASTGRRNDNGETPRSPRSLASATSAKLLCEPTRKTTEVQERQEDKKQAARKKTRRNDSAGSVLRNHTKEMAGLTTLQKLTESDFYEAMSGLLIFLNAVCVGLQTEYLAVTAIDQVENGVNVTVTEPVYFIVFQVLFNCLFLIELGLRWVAQGFRPFFQTRDVIWNSSDVFIVGSGSVELLFGLYSWASGNNALVSGKFNMLRVLRVVRLIRVAKVIRTMRFFRGFRIMVMSLVGSMLSLLWVILILSVVFYIFGITFTSACLDYVFTMEQKPSPENLEFVRHFGSISRSYVSLFMAMSGGNDWSLYYDAIDQSVVPMQYTVLFMLYVAFAVFAVVNIVTGVFVDNAMSSSAQDKDVQLSDALDNNREYTKALKNTFEDLDDDNTGSISRGEFESKLNDEKVTAYFKTLNLDVRCAKILFTLLDTDLSDEISIDEFIEGCLALQGSSTQLDMRVMQLEVEYMKTSIHCLRQDMRLLVKSSLARQPSANKLSG